MPTGYTADIKDGISFKTFALNCARAFGACVTLRDEPGGGEAIPDGFEPSDYHAKAIASSKEQLAELLAMSDEEAQRAASESWDAAETQRLMRLDEIRDMRRKYEAMLALAKAWASPTPDHDRLKKFMVEQIMQSIDFDCNENYYATPTERLDGTNWRNQQKAECVRNIAYHEKEHAAEVERAASRTRWVQALRQSLEV